VSTKPPVLITDWGPVTESARLRAVSNMKEDPVCKQRVLELLCKQMGSVAKGEIEMRRRYPELFEEEAT
jgi:hypothetical protein